MAAPVYSSGPALEKLTLAIREKIAARQLQLEQLRRDRDHAFGMSQFSDTDWWLKSEAERFLFVLHAPNDVPSRYKEWLDLTEQVQVVEQTIVDLQQDVAGLEPEPKPKHRGTGDEVGASSQLRRLLDLDQTTGS